jgi:uncharacterized membrane protein
MKPNLKTKMIYGFLVIVPLGVLIVIIAQLVKVLDIISKTIGIDSMFGAGLAVALALILLRVVCYMIGSLVHTRIGLWSFSKFENNLLSQLPGYRIIRNIISGFTGEQVESYKPALIKTGSAGISVIGFVMEENDNDTVTVFTPNVPAIAVGNLQIVSRDRVVYLHSTPMEALNCLGEWGVGSNKLIGAKK